MTFVPKTAKSTLNTIKKQSRYVNFKIFHQFFFFKKNKKSQLFVLSFYFNIKMRSMNQDVHTEFPKSLIHF